MGNVFNGLRSETSDHLELHGITRANERMAGFQVASVQIGEYGRNILNGAT